MALVTITQKDAQEMVALTGYSVGKQDGEIVIYPKGSRGVEKLLHTLKVETYEQAVELAWGMSA